MNGVTVESLMLSKLTNLETMTGELGKTVVETKTLVQTQQGSIGTLQEGQKELSESLHQNRKTVQTLAGLFNALKERVRKLESSTGAKIPASLIKYIVYLIAAAALTAAGYGAGTDQLLLP
jgi:uncharacterized coiled-coil protein SlyX